MCKALVDKILFSCGAAIAQPNNRLAGCTPQVVRYSNDSYLLHRRMLLENFFDLARINVGSAADDHIFLSIENEEVSTGVHKPNVTRVEPSIPEGVRCRLGLAPVAAHHGWTTHHHFAQLAARDLGVIGIHDSDFDSRPRDSG